MNNTLPPFNESRDKVWNAYFRDEIKPFAAEFCFCGTLCDGNSNWMSDSLNKKHNDFMFFTGSEYARMEWALFDGIMAIDGNYQKQSEDALFNGMCKAYETLKDIYIEHGLEVDDFQPVKRENKTVSM